MDIETRILNLAAKKLANEATGKELRELNSLLRKNPGIKSTLCNVFDTWDMINFEPTLTEDQIDENVALVLVKIHQHINASENKPGVYTGDN